MLKGMKAQPEPRKEPIRLYLEDNQIIMGGKFQGKFYCKKFTLKDKTKILLGIRGLGLGLINLVKKFGMINEDERLHLRWELFK